MQLEALTEGWWSAAAWANASPKTRSREKFDPGREHPRGAPAVGRVGPRRPPELAILSFSGIPGLESDGLLCST